MGGTRDVEEKSHFGDLGYHEEDNVKTRMTDMERIEAL